MENIITNKEKRQSFKKNSDEKIGETRFNTLGSKMWIIKYVNTYDLTVKFENGFSTKTQYSSFKKGTVKNPYDKSVYSIGYLGEGNYETKENGVTTLQYTTWQSMICRCYNDESKQKNPSYLSCTVCSDWFNFQNFCTWFNQNYYQIENEVMSLDKDILYKGNKLYSPENCVFVPKTINSMFTKSDASRGNYPIGVRLKNNRYEAQCSICDNIGRKQYYLGRFDTPVEAFNTYKVFKQKTIKDTAKKYKDKIPVNLYNALIKYEVNIND